MKNKSLCENCTRYHIVYNNLLDAQELGCDPIESDNKGNVIKCNTYKPKSIIRCFINFGRKNE